MNMEFLFIIAIIGIGYLFKKMNLIKEKDGETLLPFNQMFRTTLLMGFILPIGLAVIPYAHEFKYKTTILIGTISNICILVSIVLLYIFANIIL
ncbi:hypothetical protein RCG17_02565 [Neobacillus sp. PS3-12]|uniref:hypothetical protein n=1 Tax=Neobacillus sp. PS3-12 TaxID=3070677 RepID=UPI0027E1C372|nr:hypothetical protein [Neobacillus sp. PS3-12]WML53582.1 hypothetical protein RCG17_02565 [Neobacillus sp. PS3-12]